MLERHLARLSQLEQGQEGDRLIDARELTDLGVEVEAAPTAENGSKALEELRDGWEAERHVRKRHLWRGLGEQPQRGCELRLVLEREPALRDDVRAVRDRYGK